MADIADSNDPDRYAYLAEGNARQARKRVATKVVVRDVAQRILLVNPTYKAHWDLPGGMAEANEPPRLAADRELREELGLTIPIGRLLTVEWVGPHGPWDDQLVFVFDGGVLDAAQIGGLKVSDAELSAYQFATADDAATLLRPDMNRRLHRARTALTTETTSYEESDRHW
jgi:8-oxo-dGTP pyrophosphatase MutT (NUDIX family)